MTVDEKYMQRCLDIAKNGLGRTAPNPMVGSVIVHDGKIIGEGYHQKCGEAHAEVNAINSVKDKTLLKDSTLYVNLEPCAHHGKTPPCSDLIVKHKLKRVVVGCVDSFSEVSGKGIEKMREAGISVNVGILEKESRVLNRRFFTFHEQRRPYIILKWAQTIDGYIDISEEKKKTTRGQWITNDTCRSLVHRWRTEEDAIFVGTNTALLDNPSLNVRSWAGRNPVRIVLDRNLRLSSSLHLLDGSQHTIVFTEKEVESAHNVEYVTVSFSTESLWLEMLSFLHTSNIQSVIIEGGAVLLNSIINQGLWDEARIFIGNVHFGDGILAPVFDFTPVSEKYIGDSRLFYYYKDEGTNSAFTNKHGIK